MSVDTSTGYRYEHAGFHLSLGRAPAEVFQILDEYLCRSESAPERPPAAHLDVTVDPALLSERLSRLDTLPASERVEVFKGLFVDVVPDGGDTWLRPVLSAEGFADKYLVRERGDHLELVVGDLGAIPPTLPVRMFRELLVRTHESQGYVTFHGSGVWTDRGAVIFIGDRGAGKTTLMATACERLGGHLLSNDRVMVGGAAERPHVVGVPLSVRLGRGTIAASDRLVRFLAEHQLGQPQPAERFGDLPAELGSRVKYLLTPREFARAMDGEMAQEGRLRAIVFPRIVDEGPEGMSALPPSDVLRELTPHSCTPADPSSPQPWLRHRGRDNDRLAAGAQQRVRDLADHSPAYRIVCNIRAGGDPTAKLAAWIDEIG